VAINYTVIKNLSISVLVSNRYRPTVYYSSSGFVEGRNDDLPPSDFERPKLINDLVDVGQRLGMDDSTDSSLKKNKTKVSTLDREENDHTEAKRSRAASRDERGPYKVVYTDSRH
jgi:hypothetical protein